MCNCNSGHVHDSSPEMTAREATTTLSRRRLLVGSAGVAAGAALVAGTSPRASAEPGTRSAAADAAPVTGDRIVMLGVGGGPVLAPAHAEPATLLIVGETKYLIDCGSDTPRQLATSGGFAGLGNVFITHHHLDHIAGIPALTPMGWIYAPAPLTGSIAFWGPQALTKLVQQSRAAMQYPVSLFEGLPGNQPFPELRTHQVRVPAFDDPSSGSEHRPDGRSARQIVCVMEDDKVRVLACRVYHGDVPTALAYRFEIKATGKVVVFSGDRNGQHSTAADDLFLQLAADADVLVHEAVLMSAIEQILQNVPPDQRDQVRELLVGGHTDVALLPGIAAAARAKSLVLNHYVPAAAPQAAFLATARAAAAQVGYTGPIAAPTDLDVIPL